MNKILNLTKGLALMLAVFSTSANAASVSLTGPASVDAGASFSLTIVGDFSDTGLFGGGSLIGWDPALVSLDSVVNLAPGADPGFSCPGLPSCISNASSESVSWGGFNGIYTTADTFPADMATLNFTSLGGSGLAAFTIATDLLQGGWLDQDGANFDPNLTGTSVQIGAVVPVPAAVWLFGSGLLGLVGVARRAKVA